MNEEQKALNGAFNNRSEDLKATIDENCCFVCGQIRTELKILLSIGIALCDVHFVDLEHDMLQYDEIE